MSTIDLAAVLDALDELPLQIGDTPILKAANIDELFALYSLGPRVPQLPDSALTRASASRSPSRPRAPPEHKAEPFWPSACGRARTLPPIQCLLRSHFVGVGRRQVRAGYFASAGLSELRDHPPKGMLAGGTLLAGKVLVFGPGGQVCWQLSDALRHTAEAEEQHVAEQARQEAEAAERRRRDRKTDSRRPAARGQLTHDSGARRWSTSSGSRAASAQSSDHSLGGTRGHDAMTVFPPRHRGLVFSASASESCPNKLLPLPDPVPRRRQRQHAGDPPMAAAATHHAMGREQAD